jgi:ATP-dependent DNA ligase
MASINEEILPGAEPDFGLSADMEPMEARSAEALPAGQEWQYEPKWDGFRCLAFRHGEAIDIRAKSGKPLGRFFPEVVDFLRALPSDRFVIDGELVIETDGHLSFPALQMRLHPAASRIAKLSKETPARLVLFDMLVGRDGHGLLDRPLEERRKRLEEFVALNGRPGQLLLSPVTRDVEQARSWLSSSGNEATDGVVAKLVDGIYTPGERSMIKVKRLRTADCVVGGFRYQSDSEQVGSLLLGLYNDEGKLDHVGFTATISNAEREDLTKRLEALREPPGFTGKAPGGPSRWSTERSAEWQPLRSELVVEVRFDHVTDGRFRHGTKLMRWRPDKRPSQCTYMQIQPPLKALKEP